MAAKKKSAPKKDEERLAVFLELRDILTKYAKKLDVKDDSPTQYYLNTRKPYRDKELFFACAAMRKSHVGYYFFPIYMFPELAKDLSPPS